MSDETLPSAITMMNSNKQYLLGKNRGLPPTLQGSRDEYLVELTGPYDPCNAKSWPVKTKVINSAILGFGTLMSSWGSSVFSAAVEPVSAEFGVGTTVALLGLTFYICGFAMGPLAFAPLSELYGRRKPITFACGVFTCFMFAAATAKDLQTLLITRFFAGVFASCPLAVAGGAMSDMFNNEARGKAVAMYSAMIMIGPFASPIAGEFITANKHLGWRWTEYITGIMAAISFLLDIFFLKETYPKTLLQERAASFRFQTGNYAIHHISEEEIVDFHDLLHRHLLLPLRLLFQEPIVFLITIYCSFIYGILYLFLEAYPIVFASYRGIRPTYATLPYLGLIIGVIIGCCIVMLFEPRYNRKLAENNNIPVPEQRLFPMMVGAILFPIGLFWFAWAGNNPHVHWIVPTLSGLFTGAGLLTIFLQSVNYLVDAYLTVAASVIAATGFLRSFFGAAFPLFAVQMFTKLGVNWAGSLLGFLAVAFMPIPFLFYLYGKRLRQMSKFTPDFEVKVDEESNRETEVQEGTQVEGEFRVESESGSGSGRLEGEGEKDE